MFSRIVPIVVIALVWALGLGVASHSIGVPVAAASSTSHPSVALTIGCQEDMPCFNWATMGNHRRAVATTDGNWHRIVGPCTFARLMHGRYIDWTRTSHMKGDALARRLPCPNVRPIPEDSIY